MFQSAFIAQEYLFQGHILKTPRDIASPKFFGLGFLVIT
jgi:hypothetical protein